MENVGRTDHLIDLTGKRFGRLVVQQRAPRESRVKPRWACVCDCGKETVVFGSQLRSGQTKSCGCLANDGSSRRTHGASRSKLYNAWKTMHARCRNPSNARWERYGGRGIAVCSSWTGAGGFAAFMADMGPRPSDRHSIERIDNDGNYEPGNCKWGLPETQNRNRGNNLLVTHEGETKTLAEWSRSSPVSEQVIRSRFVLRGWNFEDALNTPAFGRQKQKKGPGCPEPL